MPSLSVLGLTATSIVFGPWVPVTVAEIKQPVPEWQYQRAAYGAVQVKQVGRPLPAACAIVEAGRIVGYRLTCPESE